METKEYLSEEKYQKTRKKIKISALIVLIVGVLISGSLAGYAIIKTNEIKNENKKSAEAIESKYAAATSVEAQKQIENKIESLQEEETKLQRELNTLKAERDKIFRSSTGFTEEYYSKDTEVDQKEKELSTVKEQISTYSKQLVNIKTGAYKEDMEKEISNSKKSEDDVDMLYGFAFFIMMPTLGISLSLFMTAKRREIIAYHAQETMPLYQEGMEKMAPTFAKTGKTVAEEISKGVKEGLKDEEK